MIHRLSLPVSIGTFLVGALVAALAYGFAAYHAQKSKENELVGLGQVMVTTIESIGTNQVQNYLESIPAGVVHRAILIDTDGVVLADSLGQETLGSRYRELFGSLEPELVAVLEGGGSHHVITRTVGALPVYATSIPVHDDLGGVIGALRLSQMVYEIEQLKKRTAIPYALFMLIIVVGYGRFASVYFERTLLRPIERIVHAIGRVDPTAKDAIRSWHPAVVPKEMQPIQTGIGQLLKELSSREMELEEYRRQSAQTERLATVGKLSAIATHEINNPLGGALDCIDIARRANDDQEKRTKYLDLARDALIRIQHFVGDLSRYARPHQNARGGDLRDSIDAASALFTGTMKRKQIALEIDLDIPKILPIDDGRWVEVFMNLISNAIDASPVGGRLRIEGKTEGDDVHVSIHDDGPGFSPEMMEHAFDEFVTTKADGTGLGMAIIRRIVEDHGGTVALADPPGGHVHMTIPIRDHQHGMEQL